MPSSPPKRPNTQDLARALERAAGNLTSIGGLNHYDFEDSLLDIAPFQANNPDIVALCGKLFRRLQHASRLQRAVSRPHKSQHTPMHLIRKRSRKNARPVNRRTRQKRVWSFRSNWR